MEFIFKCPACHQDLTAEEEWRGLEFSCPQCGQRIFVPLKEKRVNGIKVAFWTIVGMIVGYCLGGFLLGYLGAIILVPVIGFLAFRSSKKNGGAPPSWLWRSRKK